MNPICAAWRAIAELPLTLASERPSPETPLLPLAEGWLERFARDFGLRGIALYFADEAGFGRVSAAGPDEPPRRLPAALHGGDESFPDALARAWPDALAWTFPDEASVTGGLAVRPGPGDAAGPADADTFAALGEAIAAQMSVLFAARFVQEGGRSDLRHAPHRSRENMLSHRLKERLAPAVGVRGNFPARVGWHDWRRPDARGDFLDLLPGPDGGRGWFLIGECSGWGGTVANDVAHLLVRVRGDWARRLALGESVLHLNDHLLKEAHRGRLVSLCMGEIDRARGLVKLVRQGSTAAFYRPPGSKSDGDGNGPWRDLAADGGPPLGILDRPRVVEHEIPWGEGAALFCATDGLYAHAGPDGRAFHRGDWGRWLDECPAGNDGKDGSGGAASTEALASLVAEASNTSGGSLAGAVARRVQPIIEEGVPLDELTLLSLEAAPC